MEVEATDGAVAPRARRLAKLERQLLRVRWFGVAFGLFQVWQGSITRPVPPTRVVAIAYGLVALLALGNVGIWLGLRRVREERALRRLGVAAFALDMVVVLGTAWAYSYDRHGATWVLLYVLPLEGALRYQLRGAFATVGVAFASEIGRELYRLRLFPDLEFVFSSVTFRVGVLAIVAMVAGLMARTLARQTRKAEERAGAFEELARRESTARGELAAFHAIVMSGLESTEPKAAMQSMAQEIGRHLAYESLCIHMVGEGGMRCMASHGPHPSEEDGELAAIVASEGRPQLRAGVRSAPHEPAVQMAAPMRIGAHVIGVIEVRSTVPGGLAENDLLVLERLTDQVSLVAYHAQLQAERAQTVARLRELGELKSDFVAITSHELRTPLTGIRGFASLLLERFDELPPEEVREYLGIIDGQSKRLSRLVEDLLVVTKLDGGGLKLNPVETDVAGFLRGVAASFADEAARVTVDAEDGLWARFDPDRLEQVVRNLVHNALKFSPAEERVIVRARASGGTLEVTVSDRGVGISPDQLDNVYDRFHQTGNGSRREGEGVGLGLYITKRLVDAMDGEISAASAPGEGTTFRVTLPGVVASVPHAQAV